MFLRDSLGVWVKHSCIATYTTDLWSILQNLSAFIFIISMFLRDSLGVWVKHSCIATYTTDLWSILQNPSTFIFIISMFLRDSLGVWVKHSCTPLTCGQFYKTRVHLYL